METLKADFVKRIIIREGVRALVPRQDDACIYRLV